MPSDKIQLNDLSSFYRKIDLIRKTANQISKDFEIFGEEIKFSGNPDTAYDELKLQITPIIQKLLDTDYEKLLSVLYRIDVDEKLISESSAGDLSGEITSLIIERELKKVVTREYFKNNKGV